MRWDFRTTRMRMTFPVFEKRTTNFQTSEPRCECGRYEWGVKSSRQLKKSREVNRTLRSHSRDFSLVILKLNWSRVRLKTQ
jgi:hypothetical protein